MFRLLAERCRRRRALSATILTAVTFAAVGVPSVSAAGVQDSAPWGLDRVDQRSSDLDGKYHYRFTGAGVDVYLVGGGVRATNSEFEGRVRIGGDTTFGEGAVDCDGWGTAAVGIIGGKTWGVAKGATLVSVKSYGCHKSPTVADLIGQADWVTEDHVDGQPAVVLLDLAHFSLEIDELAEAMIDDGITVVVPAGDDRDDDSCDHSPARVPAAITVAASTADDDRWEWSNFGRCNDLFAPGDLIRSADSTDDTATDRRSGTSLAAAHVAGAAALILEQHPAYTPAQVWDAMEADATTDVMATTIDNEPDRLLHVAPASLPGAPVGLTGAVAPTDDLPSGSVRLTWDSPTDDGGAAITDYVVQDSTDGTTWRTISDDHYPLQVFQTGGFATGAPRWFRVAAKNAVGQGPWSSTVELTPLGVPSDVTGLTTTVAPATGVGAGQVKLDWTAPDDDGGAPITDYVVQYRLVEDLTSWTTFDDGVSTATTATVGGLVKSRRYAFRVTATNVVGVGAADLNAATPTGPPDAPPNLSAAVAPTTGVGSGEVKLTWTAPPDGGVAISDYIITKSIGTGLPAVVPDGESTATAFTVGGLTNGTSYSFQVWAKNALGTSPIATISSTPMWNPQSPGGLRAAVAPAAGVGSGEVKLIWNAPNGSPATDYLIERSTDGLNWTPVDDAVSPDTAFTVTGLTNGTRYRFQVTAQNDVGSSPASAEVAAIPSWTPAAPDMLSAAVAPAADVGSGEVQLTWNAPASNGSAISDYVIESSTDGASWTAVDDGLSDATGYTVGGLSNGTAYAFRVTARNEIGAGSPSDPVQAVPLWMPAAPSGLSATRGGSGEVQLGWTAPADNGSAITDYAIESSVDGTTWTPVADGVSSATTFTAAGLTNGAEYRFRIAAGNGVGRGPWSAQIAATAMWSPAAPNRLTAAVAPAPGVRSGQVKLTWRAPADNGSAIRDYVIQRSLDGTRWRTARDGASTSTSFTVRRLINGKRYEFRVAATNALGRSEWSTTVVAVPRWKPSAPAGLRAAAAGSGQVRLSWTARAANGAPITDYVIQRAADGARWRTVRDGVSTTKFRLISGLTDSTPYRFRVTAKNAVGRGPWSAAVRATPHPR
jgi:Subtilase family/Fibronectin type III domain